MRTDRKGRPPAILKKPASHFLFFSQGPPTKCHSRKYSSVEEGYNSKEAESIAKKPRVSADAMYLRRKFSG
ncbi:zinc finger protein 335 isoform X1 [Lates japonicus]|uniref:Zinc finger protein 335 isoform X1 n=1 Tax=Lates japonicus TaxID=270547 RepID=A0AAD3M1X2_LATJO|nr:zinc finger protein 335 isoform X1 [Lates japonicus]